MKTRKDRSSGGFSWRLSAALGRRDLLKDSVKCRRVFIGLYFLGRIDESLGLLGIVGLVLGCSGHVVHLSDVVE